MWENDQFLLSSSCPALIWFFCAFHCTILLPCNCGNCPIPKSLVFNSIKQHNVDKQVWDFQIKNLLTCWQKPFPTHNNQIMVFIFYKIQTRSNLNFPRHVFPLRCWKGSLTSKWEGLTSEWEALYRGNGRKLWGKLKIICTMAKYKWAVWWVSMHPPHKVFTVLCAWQRFGWLHFPK